MSSKNASHKSNTSLDRSIEAPPSIVFKMAKKIAQLTKVVYFLHSKTEDHDDEMDYLTEKIQDHFKKINDQTKLRISEITNGAEEARILLKTHEGMIAVSFDYDIKGQSGTHKSAGNFRRVTQICQ